MTNLEALTRAVRIEPWNKDAKRALMDCLQEYGIDPITAAVLLTSVARAAWIRWVVRARRKLPDRLRYIPTRTTHALERMCLVGPIPHHGAKSHDSR